jgi:hypothetical protein
VPGVRQAAGGVLSPQPLTTETQVPPPPGGTGVVNDGSHTYTFENGRITRVGQNRGGIIGGPAP